MGLRNHIKQVKKRQRVFCFICKFVLETRKRETSDDEARKVRRWYGATREAFKDRCSQQRIFIQILSPKFCAGAVIGRSGSTITRLQGTYRVRVQVQPRNQITQDSLFRGILLRGRWLDVMEAQKEIIRLIDDDVLKQNGDSSLHNLWGKPHVPLAVPQNLMHVMNNAALDDISRRTGAEVYVDSHVARSWCNPEHPHLSKIY